MEYFVGDFILFIPWFLFFILRKDLRKEILLMSMLGIPLALFDLLYVPSYWIPKTFMSFPIGIEGFIFSFLIAGIAAFSYAAIEHKKIQKISKYNRHFSLLVLLIIIPLVLVIKSFYTLNISVAMFFALLIGTSFIVFVRKDLFKSTIAGSLIFGCIYAIALILWSNLFPQTMLWFTFQNLPKLFVLNAPLYEIIFGFLFGAYWGNIYELLFGYRFK